MRLWQHADARGELHYSLLPALDDVSKTEEDTLDTLPLVSIKVENIEHRPSMHHGAGSCGVSRHMDTLMRLHKIAIDGYTCDRCDMKFPMRSMLNRHQTMHNARPKFRDGHSKQQKRVQRLKMRASRQSERSLSLKRSEEAKHTCASCDFVCNRSVTLAAHVRRRHDKGDRTNATRAKKHDCTICGYECSSEVLLDRHTRKHRSKSTASFACDACDFKCKRSTTLASHLARSHKKPKRSPNTRVKNKRRIAKCNYVSSKKTKLSAVGSHRREASLVQYEEPNLIIKEEVCTEDCDEANQRTAESTKKKESDNRKDVEVRCDLCDFTCAKKRTLYSHKRRHKEDEVYTCNECSFKTGKKSSLYSHIKRKHKEPRANDGVAQQPELFCCGQCDYKNKNKYELKVHMARKHSDDFKFSCETCGKKFKVKGDLTNHIRFSHREQPVICDVCGKTCLNSNSLYVHQKFAHYKAKYECQVCKRRMVSQENLNEHMLRQHERRENVVCEECGKTFSRNSRLKVHMRIHTGDKPYSCTVCNKAFARRTALKQHLLIHTGIRPYVCDICGKAFTQKPGLISHRKSHPGSHPPLPRVLIDHILNDVMNA